MLELMAKKIITINWFLEASKIPLVVAPILMNILNETIYAVFTFCRSSLFLKDPFSYYLPVIIISNPAWS